MKTTICKCRKFNYREFLHSLRDHNWNSFVPLYSLGRDFVRERLLRIKKFESVDFYRIKKIAGYVSNFMHQQMHDNATHIRTG